VLEEVAAEAPRRKVALEDLAETDEHARLDDPDDLALERRLPAELEQAALEQPGQAELVGLIDEQTAVLNELTTRLLTTARLDAGEVTIHATPVAVGSMIDEVLASLKDRLASMKVAVDLEREDLVVFCDRQLIIMLLTQYIDNACKYSIYGTPITIRVTRSATEVIFSVHSFGPVIPIEDRERIFDRYYRSAKHSTRASGTGIGLSVAKRVALIHSGYVWVTSDELEGTTFYAAIPVESQKGRK